MVGTRRIFGKYAQECASTGLALLVVLVVAAAVAGTGDSVLAEGSVETNPESAVLNQLALEQYVGQTQTDMITSDPPSLVDEYLAGTAGIFAGMFASTHPQHDPDPGIAEEAVEILTNEEVTSGPETVSEVTTQAVLEALSEPVVLPDGLPDGRPNTGDTPYDNCDFGTSPPSCS